MPCLSLHLFMLAAGPSQRRREIAHLELAVDILPRPGVSGARRDGRQHLRLSEADNARAVGGPCEFTHLERDIGRATARLLADALTCEQSMGM